MIIIIINLLHREKGDAILHHTPLEALHVHVALDDLWLKLRHVELRRDGRMEQQLIESHVLIIARNGEGRLNIGLHEYRLRQDAVHIALPGQTIGVSSEETGGLDLYVIRFDVCRDSGLPGKGDTFPLKGEFPIYSETQMAILCESLYFCCSSEQTLERFRAQSAFQELLYWIMKNFRLQPDSDSRTALDRTRSYMDNHYNENLTIEQLAHMAEVSPKYFVDLFKKTYGKSAMDYVTEVRVNSAKKLMVRSDARLRDIAHQVGYNDEFYFSRKFKKEVGMSPSAYMKNRRRKIAAYSAPILGQLLALNIIPFAAPLHPKWSAYYYKMYRTDIPVHLSAYRFNQDWESNIEALMSASPDLIICSRDNLHPDEKEKLEQIAPVFFISWKEKDWREQLRITATFLGVSQEADSWLQCYDQKVKCAREHLSRELGGERLLVMSIYKQNCYLCPVRGMKEVLHGDLQLNIVRSGSDTYSQIITADQLTEFDADRILVNVCQEPESLGYWQLLQTSPLWQDLKAVRRNHVYPISSDPWREYSAYACERMVDDLLRLVYGDHPN